MDNEELEKIMKESTEFVDRLKDKVHEQYFEIERLNKVLDELEKWVNNIMFTEGTYCINCMQVLNKIKKLKGER